MRRASINLLAVERSEPRRSIVSQLVNADAGTTPIRSLRPLRPDAMTSALLHPPVPVTRALSLRSACVISSLSRIHVIHRLGGKKLHTDVLVLPRDDKPIYFPRVMLRSMGKKCESDVRGLSRVFIGDTFRAIKRIIVI